MANYKIGSGVTSTGITLNEHESMYVMSCGRVSKTTVNNGGRMQVNSGGTANSTTVNYGGWMQVNNSAVASITTVTDGGLITIMDGWAYKTTVNYGGTMEVSSGGSANNTTVNNSGTIIVLGDSGYAGVTEINSGGVMEVYNGSTVNGITVHNGGQVYVNDGCKLTGMMKIEADAVVSAYDGSTLDFNISVAGSTSSTYIALNDLSLIQGEPDYTLTVDVYQTLRIYRLAGNAADFDKTITVMNTSGGKLGTLTVGSGRTIIGDKIYTLSINTSSELVVTVTNLYDLTGDLTGTFELTSGMIASGVNISGRTFQRARLHVSSGGFASMTTVNRSATVDVSSGGVVDTTTISSGGSMNVLSGGVADTTMLNSSGSMDVSSGGVVNNTSIFYSGTLYVSGGVASNTTVFFGGIYDVIDGMADTTTVSSGGGMRVFSSGAASNTTVSSGGGMRVFSSGVACNTTVSSGGITVSEGGVADTTIVNSSGRILVASGGVASNTTVSSGGSMTVVDGGKLSGRMTFAPGANVDIQEGSVIDFDLTQTKPGADALINDFMFVGSNPSFTLTVDNTLPVGNYRLADMVEVFSKTITIVNTSGVELGTLTVEGGTQSIDGRDYTLTLDDDDTLCVTISGEPRVVDLTGALYTSADLTEGMYGSSVSIGKPGLLTVFEGGLAHRTTVNSGGKLYVDGGSATETTVNPSGEFNLFGGTASSTTVNNGSLGVYSGGMANDTIISGGTFFIHDGTANNTTVSSGGTLKVAYGGKLTGKMTFEYGAVVSAYYGAILDFDISALEPGSDIRINDLSRVSVPDWGANYTLTVSGTQANGKYKLAEGAAGFDKTISVVNTSGVELGTLTVGQTANIDGQDYKLTLDGGSLGVTIGAAAPAVDLSGDLSSEFDLTSGMIGSSVNILNGGELYVLEGATADTVAVNPGGYLGVYSGGSASGIVAEEGAYLGFTIAPDTYAQGSYAGKAFEITDNTANGITVMSGGCLFASDGGKATDTTVESGGYFELNYGCEANGVTVASGGSLNAVGSASGIVAEEGAHLEFYVAPGAYVQGTYGGSAFEIDSSVSGYAVHTGRLNLYEDGTADDVTVESGGEFVIYGGTATNVVENGGYVTILDDAVVTFAAHEFTGGTVQSPRTVTAHSGTIVTDTTLESGGVLEIHEGGIAKNTTVNAEGCLDLEEGGIAKNITVNDGGFVEVSRNGKLTGKLTFESGATLYAYVGAILDFDLTQTAPGADALMNGVAHALVTTGFLYTLTVDGTEAAGDYKLAEEAVDFDYDDVITIVNTSGVELGTLTVEGGTQSIDGRDYTLTLDDDDTLCVTISGEPRVIDLTGDLSKGFALANGKFASSVNILEHGTLSVRNGGLASRTTVNSGGSFLVGVGGSADVIDVNFGGVLMGYDGGTLTQIRENGGYAIFGVSVTPTFVPNSFSGVTLADDIWATVHSGTTATQTTVDSNGGICVFDGGIASMTTVNSGGSFLVYEGGSASGVTVASGGKIVVTSTGTASGIVAEEGADLTIDVAPGTDVQGTYAGSAFRIDSSVSGYTIHSGTLYVLDGGSADDVTVNTYCQLRIGDGGTATRVRENGGLVYTADGANVTFASNTFSGVQVSGVERYATVHSGTTATDTTLIDGGMLLVYKGGLAIDTTVKSDCEVDVGSSGKLTGKLTFEAGAIVFAGSGAILDLDLTRTTAGADALVNDMSFVKDQPFVWTLTVSGSEAAGSYKLAENAAGFDKTITVVNTSGVELGTLTVEGGTQTIGGRDYTLTVDGGTLGVTLEGSAPAPGNMFFEGDFNGDLFDTLAVESGSTVTIYQNGEAWGLGVTLDPGWTVVGTGDFSGDGLDDFLRVNTEGYVVGEMSNGNGTFSPQVLNLKNTGWEILGTGDFNGNGTDDVLIANPTGASETVGLLGYWESGVTWTLINGYSPEWECVATGDYNGDGKCDMLWKNSFVGDGGLTYNAYCTWIVDNPVDWRMVSVANPAEWNFLCAGDFDGDKMNDIAMINDVGVVGIWGVNDGYLSSWSILSAVTSEWQLAGVADFNADGTDDIAWSNVDTGLTGYWQIENKELASWANIATIS